MYHFTDGGLRNVWLSNGYTEQVTPYGNGVSFYDVDGLMIAICRSLCDKPGKLTGAEFRYVRTGLSLSQKAVGKLFGYTEQAVAKWEKYGKVPKTIDAALRVVFIERHNNNHLVPKMIDLLDLIDRIANSRVVASVVNAKWVAKHELHSAGNPLPAAASRSELADA